MRKFFITSIVSMAIGSAAFAAPSPRIIYTNGVYTIPDSTTATVFENFDGGVTGTGYVASTQSSGAHPESVTGLVTTQTGIIDPAAGNQNYLSVGANGLFTVDLAPTLTSVGVTVFSFSFGSLDTFNSLRLFFQDGTSQLYTGREIIGLANNQPNPSTYAGVTGRVTFDTQSLSTITRAQFGSTGFTGFEIDGLASSAVPEPAIWLVLIFGFLAIGGVLRFRHNPSTAFD